MPFKSLPEIIEREVTWGKTLVTDDIPMHFTVNDKDGNEVTIHEAEMAPKGKKSYWPIFAAGAGLFSDGYVNSSIGTVNTCLLKIYGDQYSNSRALQNVSAIAFVGTVVGQVTFGFVSDYISRKTGMLISSGGLIVFSILAAGSWGVGTESKVGGNAGGLFTALTCYRFFLGIFIGAEYPTASSACAEAAALLKPAHRNRYFIWFTDLMIEMGFVISSFVPLVMLWICGPDNLQPVWRVTLGLGAVFPFSLFIMRIFFKESNQFNKVNFKGSKVPWIMVLKFYWPRLLAISIIWWIYDFSSYAFGIFSSPILHQIIKDHSLYKTFGWNVVLNVLSIPGAVIGAVVCDYLGPRLTLTIGLGLQTIVGFIMAGLYPHLINHVGAFVVVYGIFMTLGEFGPGNNLGLLAAKTTATPVRGVYYGIAAAVGKIGAFCGTYAFPAIIKHYKGQGYMGYQVPFYLASSLAFCAGLIAFFGLPPVDQESFEREDFRFLQYLANNGYDITQLGDGTIGKEINTSDESLVEQEIEFVEDDKKLNY